MHAWEELVARCAHKRAHELGELSNEAYLELEGAVRANPDKFVADDEERAFLELCHALDRMARSLADDEFRDDDAYMDERARRRERLALDCRHALEADAGCTDARTLLALTTCDADALLDELDASASDAAARMSGDDAPDEVFLRPYKRLVGVTARTLLETGRARMARTLCERSLDVDRSDPMGMRMTLALALARLEDEDGLDALDARHGRRGNAWIHLARAVLLYKLDRMGAAERALAGFCTLCEGGAFALLRPSFVETYLPDRPDFAPGSFSETMLAVHEADPLIVDAPDFVGWAEGRPGVTEAAEAYAESQGLDW